MYHRETRWGRATRTSVYPCRLHGPRNSTRRWPPAQPESSRYRNPKDSPSRVVNSKEIRGGRNRPQQDRSANKLPVRRGFAQNALTTNIASGSPSLRSRLGSSSRQTAAAPPPVLFFLRSISPARRTCRDQAFRLAIERHPERTNSLHPTPPRWVWALHRCRTRTGSRSPEPAVVWSCGAGTVGLSSGTARRSPHFGHLTRRPASDGSAVNDFPPRTTAESYAPPHC